MLTKLTDKEFNEFSKKHPLTTFFQSSYWGDLKQTNGWKKHLVGLKKDDVIVGASLILAKKIPVINKYIFYAPRGFLLDYNDSNALEEFSKEVIKYIKKEHGIFLKINPYVMYQERDIEGNIVSNGINNQKVVDSLIKIGFKHHGFTTKIGADLEPRWLSVLDLENETEESLLSKMRSTTRLDVLNSYKRGLRLIEANENRIAEFKDLMEHTSERRGFLDRPLHYYLKMYECFKKEDNIKIMLVELNCKGYLDSLDIQKSKLLKKIDELKDKMESTKGKRMFREFNSELESTERKIKEVNRLMEEKGDSFVIAGGLFMTFGKQVISLFGGSYREYMKFNGQYFLNFEMIKYALNNNYDKYNFFGIEGNFDKDSEMYGLFDFKKGFGAKVVELIGEFNYVINKPVYRLYETTFKIYRKFKNKIHK